MDTFVLNAITQELQQHICPSKLNSIWQPDEFSVVLGCWTRAHDNFLVISIAPQSQYLFLTTTSPKNQVFAFGKFLQHHIKGGELRAISKPALERILTFDISKRDIDGQELKFRLILEIMGRHSNLILVNQASGKILESLRHVTAAQSSYRRIAPGAPYIPPPRQPKHDPTTLDKQQFIQLLDEYQANCLSHQEKKLPFWKFFLQRVQGFSPLIAKEIAGQEDTSDIESRWQRFCRIVDALNTGAYQPQLLLEPDKHRNNKPVGIAAFPLHTHTCTPMDSMNLAAEQYYRTIMERQSYTPLKQSLLHALNARLTKLTKQRRHLQTQQDQIERAEDYKRQGELLTANLYRVKKGMPEVQVIDYYTEDQATITIPLDPRLTPAQNAQRYFKRYTKLKRGRDVTMQRLQEAEQQIAYLEELIFFVEETESLERLEELHTEFQEFDSPRQPQSGKRQHTPQKSSQPFLRLVSSDGFEIYVGRSSKENDRLTQRTALPDDIWLHVYQAPGSHVIILNRNRNKPVPERTLHEAASLAAYYSKLKHSAHVDVIYTPKKYVKKPKGSPPGLVTVSQFQTIRVAPKKQFRHSRQNRLPDDPASHPDW